MLCLVICGGSPLAHAQDGPFNFQHLSTSQGLSYNKVNTILQDRRGFIWVGTRDGLNRHDSHSFKVYKSDPEDSLSLQNNWVEGLVQDTSGFIWVLSSYGLSRFDPVNEVFDRFRPEDLHPILIGAQPNILFLDSRNRVWVGGSNGMLCIDARTGKVRKFMHQDGDPTSFPPGIPLGIDEGPNGNIWIRVGEYLAYSDSGVNWHRVDLPGTPHANDIVYGPLLIDGNELVAAIQGLGMARMDLEDHSWKVVYDPNNPEIGFSSGVNALFKDSEGRLWIGTNKGLYLLKRDNDYVHFTHNPLDKSSLSGNSILCLYEDAKGLLWIGTEESGLNIWDPYRLPFVHYSHNPFNRNSLSHNNVLSGIEVGEHGLWITTWGGGINYLDRRTGTFTHYNSSTHPQVFTNNWGSFIQFHHSDTPVLNVPGSGLFLPDAENGTFTPLIHRELPEGSPFRQGYKFVDSQNRMYYWWENVEGFLFNDPSTGLLRHYRQDPSGAGLADNRVTDILESDDGRIWIGLGNEGGMDLFSPETGTFTHFSPDPSRPKAISQGRVNKLYKDRSGNIWILHRGQGIDRLPRRAMEDDAIYFEHYTQENSGIEGDVIMGVLEDDRGRIWVCTIQGVYRLEPESGSFKKLELSEAFQGFNFEGFKKGESGKFYVGTSNGLFVFDPNELRQNSETGPVFITDFRINNESVPINGSRQDTMAGGSPLKSSILNAGSMQLTYAQNDFSFEFALLNYTQPEKNHYWYRLSPYDENWQDAETGRPYATYTNIPPGTYTFKVLAMNNDGYRNVKGASVQMYIRPPWWQRWWAYALFALFALLAFLALFLYQRRRWKLYSSLQLEREKANRLLELNQFKNRIYTNITHEFRTPLTVIRGMAGKIAGNERIRTLIQNNSDRLLNMVNQLLDLSRLESERMDIQWVHGDIIPFLKYLTESCHSLADNKKINLAFFSEVERLEMDYDEDKVQQILINLLSNALKFTPEYGSVKVVARKVDRQGEPCLEVMVTDTGKGIPADKLPHIFDRFYQVDSSSTSSGEGSGIGLALAGEMAQLLKGNITVESEPGIGSTFFVILPVLDQAKEAPENGFPHLRKLVPEEGAAGSAIPTPRTIGLNRPAGKKPRILIVEDHADVVEYIVACLEGDYSLRVARNGKEGYEQALETVPDIVLCDVMMPEMDGLELCRRLKADRKTSHVPIVLLTARAGQNNKLEGLAQGADAYLVKPFDPEELRLRIGNLLEQNRRLQAYYSSAGESDIESADPENQEAAFLRDLHQVLDQNLNNENFDTRRLCRAMAMSRTQLHRKLKALTGQPTASYIRSYRLGKALNLLEKTDLPVGDIAFQVGYKDFSHFSRNFSKEFGFNPSETRK